ncbi:hypothetical protein EIJ81_00325 (plasmid) [Aliivibrio salmonicida]|uniref:hypothetical protein n=1 Tax=Aliivibrio salmonicida TaxID=40269 RepID=UPI000F70115D|nr:hypothetical protein [Aliivibrio salmonicida]AZL83346.1 hypothetical protein EIJ81_00325 [Aliivibrio salmonicida]
MSGTSSPSWELLIKIVTASNNQNYDEMYALIETSDFSDKQQAAHAAISAIELVQDNLDERKEALLKFVNNVDGMDFDFREAFRFSLLKGLLGITEQEPQNQPS